MARIRDEFPEVDINQSTMNEMLKQCATDERNIKEMLVQEERESRIKELQSQFTAVPREVIVQILSSVKWDVEAAILPLFNTLEKYQKVQEDEIKKQADLRQSQMPRPDDKIKIETVEPKVESPFKENVATDAKPAETKQTVTLTATPSHVDVKQPITVTWELTSGQSSPYDWIGLFQLETTNKSYLTYQWRGPNDKGCTLTFPAPTTLGTFEFRYLPYGSYSHIAISNPITVGPKIQLECKQDKNILQVNWKAQVSNEYSNAWIGLYKCEESNHKNFITWEYAKSPEIILGAPVTPGNYEIRYFPYSYTHVATSNQVKIEGKDTVEIVKKTDNVVTVKVGIVTRDPYYDSVWIGMYEVKETNNKNLKRYLWIKERFSDNIIFTIPTASSTSTSDDDKVQYELRVFANKNYDTILVKSEPFSL